METVKMNEALECEVLISFINLVGEEFMRG